MKIVRVTPSPHDASMTGDCDFEKEPSGRADAFYKSRERYGSVKLRRLGSIEAATMSGNGNGKEPGQVHKTSQL